MFNDASLTLMEENMKDCRLKKKDNIGFSLAKVYCVV